MKKIDSLKIMLLFYNLIYTTNKIITVYSKKEKFISFKKINFLVFIYKLYRIVYAKNLFYITKC